MTRLRATARRFSWGATCRVCCEQSGLLFLDSNKIPLFKVDNEATTKEDLLIAVQRTCGNVFKRAVELCFYFDRTLSSESAQFGSIDVNLFKKNVLDLYALAHYYTLLTIALSSPIG